MSHVWYVFATSCLLSDAHTQCIVKVSSFVQEVVQGGGGTSTWNLRLEFTVNKEAVWGPTTSFIMPLTVFCVSSLSSHHSRPVVFLVFLCRVLFSSLCHLKSFWYPDSWFSESVPYVPAPPTLCPFVFSSFLQMLTPSLLLPFLPLSVLQRLL